MNKTHPGESFVHPDIETDTHANDKILSKKTTARAERNGGFSNSVTSLNVIQKLNTSSRPKESDTDTAQNIDTKEITKMLFIVTIVFILSFLPHLILMILNATSPGVLTNLSPVGVIFYNIFLRTFVINNMANPIVYYVCLTSFRTLSAEKLRSLCCLCCKRHAECSI